MSKKQITVITLLLVVIFILLYMVTSRLWFRFDLTKSKAYTISKVSRNLHTEIPDYINITYYLSNKLKNMVPAPGEIEDTLREYAAHSKGKIRVTVRDPANTELMGSIEDYGIQPRQIQTVEKDQASLVTVYSGIVIEYIDKIDVLPWVISTSTLEYDLTSRIRSIITDTRRMIGVIVTDSYRQWRNDFGYLAMMLNEAGYEVRVISTGDEIPDNLPSLFVLGGSDELDDWALYRIDRYIQQGGKVMFAVKGIYVDTASGSIEARKYEETGLLEMISSYGVTIRPELALDKNALTLQYQTRMPSGAIQYRIIRYPFWIGVLADNANINHPLGAGFSGIDLYWPSPLEIHSMNNVKADVIFTGTDQGWSMIDTFYTSPDTTYLLEKDAANTKGKKIFCASLIGEFPSFFSGVEKPVREGSSEQLPDMPPKTNSTRMIVVGDTDFATNMMNVTGANYNLDFLLRAADWLVSDDDIIGIRNREPHIGRLDKIIDSDRKAGAMFFSQIINVALIPLLIIIFGLAHAARRKKRNLTT